MAFHVFSYLKSDKNKSIISLQNFDILGHIFGKNIFIKENNLSNIPPLIFKNLKYNDIFSLLLVSKLMEKNIKESLYWKIVLEKLIENYKIYSSLSQKLGWFS